MAGGVTPGRDRASFTGRSMVLVPGALGALFLNVLFTYTNVEPTPWVRVTARLSVEAALLLSLLALGAALGWRITWPRRIAVAGLVSLAVLLRYVHITVPGVMGRELDAYSDLPHLRSVVGMFTESLPAIAVVGLLAAALLLFGLLLVAVVAALRALEPPMRLPRLRAAIWLATAVLLAVAAGGAIAGRRPELLAEPVTEIAARHVARLRSGGREMEVLRRKLASPEEAVALPALGGASVVVIFLESYGVTLIEDPQHYPYVAPRFAAFEDRLRSSGFAVRSAKLVSPAFGGGSWRAHATLLSGVRIENQHAYDLLLASHRRTLVHLLAAAGYRTTIAVPGIRGEWPAARFFGFDAVYDAERLAYQGESIGWWVIPDQYTLFEIGRRELQSDDPPVFSEIVLITTHIPYLPIPPVVDDWSRFADGTAYARAIPSVAADDYRDTKELSSRYVRAFLYELQILEDFLVERLPENTLVIVAGDHQPPKLATHTNDSWAVPIHVLSRRAELVEPFGRVGFEPRLVPREPPRLGMEDFLPTFLRLFAPVSGGVVGTGRP